MMLITLPSCALGVSLHDHNGIFAGVSPIALPVHLHKLIRHFKGRGTQGTYSSLMIRSTMANCYDGPQFIKSEFKIFMRLKNLELHSCGACTAYSFNIVLRP